MAKIEFPKPLKQLLDTEESDLHAPIRALADRVGEIVTDNKLPFFPDYTDHGIDHINCVLKSEVELIPKHVWDLSKKDSEPRLLCDADAAVIIGATLLHDIAMHLHPDGFRELVSENSRFKPLPWFKERNEDHSADRPWDDLWDDYAREARRFNDRTLGNIIGLKSSPLWKFKDLPEDAGQWERNHFLIVGEFIRRHHARLAHEIAIYGFPGLPVGSGVNQFPAMGQQEGHPLMRLADLIGLTARSHGTSLRFCQNYIQSNPSYLGTPRPMGTAVLYPMALLRVADYLQIDGQRAPAVLLQLKNPQSPISVQEWKKHLAVQNISPATDPRGKMVTVSAGLTLELYLQLRDLLAGLQSEMDHSTAVLDEAYGSRLDLGLNYLSLATRRVYSNLNSSVFRDSLPYVPEMTSFAADPNLLTLLVEPLYGNEPSVGIRELIQNSVDAVSELKSWCETYKRKATSLDLIEQDSDVVVEFFNDDKGTWILRVSDKGIGMKSDTIQNYFLRAGASFRQSSDWAADFLEENGQSRVLRAGRFGVGAFAIFLLGPTFRLWTRHVKSEKTGFAIEASASSNLIEIRRVDDLSIGTQIEVELSSEAVVDLGLNSATSSVSPRKCNWFCWDWPTVSLRIIRESKTHTFPQQFAAPIRQGDQFPEWSSFSPPGFDAVFWSFPEEPGIVCNGIRIGYPDERRVDNVFSWSESVQLRRPSIAILDSACNLPLTTQRYGLARGKLPFGKELERDVTLSFIAHALICGPMKHIAHAGDSHVLDYHPLSLCRYTQREALRIRQRDLLSSGLLRWCSIIDGFVPADPWLFSLLKSETIFIFGVSDQVFPRNLGSRQINVDTLGFSSCASMCLDVWMEPHSVSGQHKHRAIRFFTQLCQAGVAALGHDVLCSNAIVSSDASLQFKTNDKFVALKEPSPDGGRHWHRLRFGDCPTNPSLEDFLRKFEDRAILQNQLRRGERRPHTLYVAELKVKQASTSPISLIASIWNECLGPSAIPFNQVARDSLIEHGRQHLELRRHIEAWEEMKRTGSKWVTN